MPGFADTLSNEQIAVLGCQSPNKPPPPKRTSLNAY
jgi:hypothetical protein